MIVVTEKQTRLAQQMLGHIPGAVKKALAGAINRAAEGARTEAVRGATEQYYIGAAEVRGTIKISKAQSTRLISYVRSRATGRPLSLFKVNPGKPATYWDRPDILKVATTKRGSLKPLSKAFVEIGRTSGNIHVLSRVGRERYPLRIQYGPSVPQMLGQERIAGQIERRAMVTLNDRLDHEINRLLRGYGK